MKPVKVGDRAPDFVLESQDGTMVNLSEMLARGSVVVFFYPKDGSRGCTAEAGAFRESHARFRELGAEVVGISSDSVSSHKDFASDCDLPFRILSDKGGRVRRSFGVTPSLGLIPGRATYVIDRSGIVREVFSSQLQVKLHAERALEALRRIQTDQSTAK